MRALYNVGGLCSSCHEDQTSHKQLQNYMLYMICYKFKEITFSGKKHDSILNSLCYVFSPIQFVGFIMYVNTALNCVLICELLSISTNEHIS